MSGQDIIIEQLREELEKAHAASEYQTRRIEHYRTQLDFCERRAEKAERFVATADSEWKARAEKAEREFADRLDHLTAAVKRGDVLQARVTELEKRLAASRAIVDDLKSTIRREEVRGDTAIRERDEARAERDARPDISAEDAALVRDVSGLVGVSRVYRALMVHAAKAVRP